MATLHGIPPATLGDKFKGATQSTPQRVLSDMAAFEQNWRSFGQPSVALEIAYDWLKTHIEFAEGRRAILHSDVAFHNILVHNDRISALLDWELACVGNPAEDLAYAHSQVVQIMPWEEFLAEYRSAGATLPTEREIDFYRLWCNAWRLNFCLVTRALFHAGISTEILLGYASQHVYQIANQELHAMLKQVHARY
jgi:aminoglycoside phosphotransferase (APT) family kinase protein